MHYTDEAKEYFMRQALEEARKSLEKDKQLPHELSRHPLLQR